MDDPDITWNYPYGENPYEWKTAEEIVHNVECGMIDLGQVVNELRKLNWEVAKRAKPIVGAAADLLEKVWTLRDAKSIYEENEKLHRENQALEEKARTCEAQRDDYWQQLLEIAGEWPEDEKVKKAKAVAKKLRAERYAERRKRHG